MAYNLQTLITILEGILDLDQSRWIVDENNPHLQSLLDKATSLQQLLDKSSLTKLDTQIREVAHRAEDIIESHMVDHILSGSGCVRFTFSTPDLQQVILDLDSLMEQAEKLVEMEDNKMPRELDSAMEQQLKLVEMEDKKMPREVDSAVEEQLKLVEMDDKKMLVGIDADLMQLKDRLNGQQQKREIVPIVAVIALPKAKSSCTSKFYVDLRILAAQEDELEPEGSEHENQREKIAEVTLLNVDGPF
ncbi:putative disease resistance protein [Salvia divinorum]|uniref:Disease resistance protein n=1 Tax=Salvia divinorum TaxID=28513 RepID=A0ABD1HZR7_SALDI